jgi:hypothetical protein
MIRARARMIAHDTSTGWSKTRSVGRISAATCGNTNAGGSAALTALILARYSAAATIAATVHQLCRGASRTKSVPYYVNFLRVCASRRSAESIVAHPGSHCPVPAKPCQEVASGCRIDERGRPKFIFEVCPLATVGCIQVALPSPRSDVNHEI